jgi:hypothetical protein
MLFIHFPKQKNGLKNVKIRWLERAQKAQKMHKKAFYFIGFISLSLVNLLLN